jgi:hypothetical protein
MSAAERFASRVDRALDALVRRGGAAALKIDLSPGVHYCGQCHARTSWVWAPRARVQRCSECGALFPCGSSRCGHLDCAAVRLAILDAGTTPSEAIE